VNDIAGNTAIALLLVDSSSDTTPPTVTKLGNGTIDYTLVALGTATLTFSEAITEVSKAVVVSAITAGSDKVLTYSWNAGNTELTITGHGTDLATFANDVTADVNDIAGNTAIALLLVDSQ